MKSWKKAIDVLVVCLTVFSVMQMTAFAADAQLAAQTLSVGTVIGNILGGIVFAPYYILRALFMVISAPFVLIFG